MKRFNTTSLFGLGLLFLLTVWSLGAFAGGESQSNAHEHRLLEAKGEHGGKLLLDGEVSLELAIYERGVPPEFRAWIRREGSAVSNAQLSVTLTRLGGQREQFNFVKEQDYWLGKGVVKEPHSFDVMVNLELDGKTHQWRWASHEGRVEIDSDMAKKVGIVSQVARSGQIERHVLVYGQLITPPERKAQIHARFPGVVKSVRVDVGEQVTKGQLLAVVESNASLQNYSLRSPITGFVQARTVSEGEVTSQMPLLTLVNHEVLRAELKVFPGQRAQVQAGQPVHIVHGDHVHESDIKHVRSVGEQAPYVLASVLLNNEKQDLAPGDLVRGQIDVERVKVPLVVENRAIQSFRDWKVVFIQVGNTYEIRPLELGRSDARFTEVLEGLEVGDHYVVENSYLIKADIEKSGASHDH